MDPLPDKLTRGPKFLRKCVNAVRDYAVASRVTNVIVRERYDASEPLGWIPRRTPLGQNWILVVGGGGDANYAFKVTNASTLDDGARVQIRLGSITDFSDNPPVIPTGMVDGDDPPCYVPITVSGKVYIELTVNVDLDDDTNYGKIISALFDNDTVTPTNDYDAGLFYIPLASVVLDSGNVTVSDPISSGCLGFELCGELGKYWTVSTNF